MIGDRPRSGGAFRLAFLAALAVVGGRSVDAAEAARRPNIILIMSDDMGYSDLGCYGGEIETPNLDRLAAGGLRFTQFYNTARCCPTRAALLTGLYSHQAGIGHMMEDKGLDGYRGDLNDHCVTIAEALRPAGYRTYALGKWHVTKSIQPDGPKFNWPLQRGFDRYYGTIVGAGSFFDPGALTRDNTAISPFADPEYTPERYYYTDAIADNAARFVADHRRDHAEQPFFMYVAFTAAHWPMHAPDEAVAKYKGRYDAGYDAIRKVRVAKMRRLGLLDPGWEPNPTVGDWEEVEDKTWELRGMEVYAAMIDLMDRGIGRIVESVADAGQLDDTLILFLQDNGGCAENQGREKDNPRPDHPTLPPIPLDALRQDVVPKQTRAGFPTATGPNVLPGPPDTYIAYGRNWANVSNTPFREYKHWEHEGGISTPLIAHWPAGIAADRRDQFERQPGHLIDLMATCVDLAGATYPAERQGSAVTPMEGTSLRPAFEGKALGREGPIFWEHEGNRAVRDGKWKLVAKGPRGKWELYDMEADRTEIHDLASSEPERLRSMVEQWEAWAHRANVLPWIWRPAYGAPPSPDRYELRPDDDLASGEAPYLVNRPFRVTVEILESADRGVLIAQGGAAEGFALYLDSGRPVLALRRGNELARLAAAGPLPPAPVQLVASIAADGKATLEAGGTPLARGDLGGLLSKMPVDGLQVGRDLNGVVGDYRGPNPFQGKIGDVVIELGPARER